MEDNIEYWISRYEKLFDILSSPAGQSDDFKVTRSTKREIKFENSMWPNDFEAFRSVFAGDIGFHGCVFVDVEEPEKYQTSEIFECFMCKPEEVSGEELFKDSEIKISDVYWFGYTASAFDILGFYEREGSMKLISTFSNKETFDSFLCESFEEKMPFSSTELAPLLRDWIKV